MKRPIPVKRLRQLRILAKVAKWGMVLLVVLGCVDWYLQVSLTSQLSAQAATLLQQSGPLIPVWAVAGLGLVGGLFAWAVEVAATYMLRISSGLCPGCGYDRAGLTTDAPCPECGAAPTKQS